MDFLNDRQVERIELDYAGEVREAWFRIDDGLLRVLSDWGENVARAGPEARALALILFCEILEVARCKGKL